MTNSQIFIQDDIYFRRCVNIGKWKNDCYVLTLRFFSVPYQGAYVINF